MIWEEKIMADLFHRVSIRKYQEKKVEPEKLDYILRASMAAPSACNQQPWEFYIVEDPEILEELSETTPYAKLTAKAPVAIVTAYRKECTVPAYAQIDLSICMENMWLATDEVGLGGVWMGIAPLEDRMEEVEKIIGIPESQRAFGIFALGYPAEERTQQDRYDETRIHRVTEQSMQRSGKLCRRYVYRTVPDQR